MSLYAEPTIQSVSVYRSGARGSECKAVEQTGAEFLRERCIDSPVDEEQQALRTCPETVRLAIASHFTWWFLARSQSYVVRTLAHAFISACHFTPYTGLKCIKPADRTNHLAGVLEGRDARAFAIMPYRILNYFGKYMHDSGATGNKANLMDKRNWDQYLRPNARTFAAGRSRDSDNMFGCAGHVDHDAYDQIEREGGWVRSSLGRMVEFCEGVRPAMQPFFTTQFTMVGPHYQKLRAPGTLIHRPRSKRMVAMIPRSLAHGMEQVAAEVPFAIRYVQGSEVWRQWVQREAAKYAEAREELAMQAMARRIPIQHFLAEYDATATVGYAMPGIESRVEQCHMGENVVEIRFPGLNQD